MDMQKSSRFNAINLMREKSNRQLLIWEKFETLDWDAIEALTEDARVNYNNFIDKQ